MIPPLKKLFSIIRQKVYSACTAEELEAMAKYRTVMLRVLDHIDEHLSEKITLEELCGVSGYKSAWFLEIFRGMLGLSPIEYINFARSRRARSLLVNTDMPIGEVGRACGYASQIYFNRVFKSYLGCTPKEYRREYVIELQD